MRKRWFYVLAFMTMSATMVVGFAELFADLSHNLVPWWADSVGIPLFGGIALYTMLILPLVAFCALVTIGYRPDHPSVGVAKFRRLPRLYQWYFVVSSLCLAMVAAMMIPYPLLAMAPFVAGMTLFNVLLYAGVQAIDKSSRLCYNEK